MSNRFRCLGLLSNLLFGPYGLASQQINESLERWKFYSVTLVKGVFFKKSVRHEIQVITCGVLLDVFVKMFRNVTNLLT